MIIAEVRLHVGDYHDLMCQPLEERRAPATLADAKFSLPFLVSVAIVRRGMSVTDFSAAGLRDPEGARGRKQDAPRRRSGAGLETGASSRPGRDRRAGRPNLAPRRQEGPGQCRQPHELGRYLREISRMRLARVSPPFQRRKLQRAADAGAVARGPARCDRTDPRAWLE